MVLLGEELPWEGFTFGSFVSMAKVENSDKQCSGLIFVHFSLNEMKAEASDSTLHIFGFTQFIYSVCLASGRKNNSFAIQVTFY